MKRTAKSSSSARAVAQSKRMKKSKSASRSKSGSSTRSSSSEWASAFRSEEGNIGYNQMVRIGRDARLYSDLDKLPMVPYQAIHHVVEDFLAAVDEAAVDIPDEKEVDKVGALYKLLGILMKSGALKTVASLTNAERKEHVMRVISSGLQAIYINIYMNTDQATSSK